MEEGLAEVASTFVPAAPEQGGGETGEGSEGSTGDSSNTGGSSSEGDSSTEQDANFTTTGTMSSGAGIHLVKLSDNLVIMCYLSGQVDYVYNNTGLFLDPYDKYYNYSLYCHKLSVESYLEQDENNNTIDA